VRVKRIKGRLPTDVLERMANNSVRTHPIQTARCARRAGRRRCTRPAGRCWRWRAYACGSTASSGPSCCATAAEAAPPLAPLPRAQARAAAEPHAKACASGASRSAAECNRVLCSCVGWQQCGRRGRCAHSSMSMLLLVMLTLPCTVWVRLAEHVQQVGVFERIID